MSEYPETNTDSDRTETAEIQQPFIEEAMKLAA